MVPRVSNGHRCLCRSHAQSLHALGGRTYLICELPPKRKAICELAQTQAYKKWFALAS